MNPAPTRLFRFRPLSDELLERELTALTNSYLYAPAFSQMNDPMEAFYRFDESSNNLIDLIVPGLSSTAQNQIVSLTQKAGLISFARSQKSLLMWGYYASGFRGVCLEFDTNKLNNLSRLKNEPLRKVIYENAAHRAISTSEILDAQIEHRIVAILSKKHNKWAHEGEWRFITGETGRRYYADDALVRVYLGPAIKEDHASRICSALRNRPVEILKGFFNGYDLKFSVLQSASKFEDCDRSTKSLLDTNLLTVHRPDVTAFLKVPHHRFINECQRLASHPNFENIADIYVAIKPKDILRIQVAYRLRDNIPAYLHHDFDHKMRSISHDNRK